MGVSVFIPCYNESKRIVAAIENIKRQLEGLTYEIIIIDDGSTDTLYNDVIYMYCKDLNVRMYPYEFPSRREHLAESFKFARYQTIVWLDADMSSDISELKQRISELRKNKTDLYIGSKYLGEYKRGFIRAFISKYTNRFICFLLKTDITDHFIGYKIANKKKLIKVVDEMGFDLKRSMAWDVELIYSFLQKGYIVREFPIYWEDKTHSSSLRIKDGFKILKHILKLWWKYERQKEEPYNWGDLIQRD